MSWEARYDDLDGNSVAIPETAISECPESLVTIDSIELVNLHAKALVMREAFGAVMFGPDLRKWPSRLVDAFAVLETERARVKDIQLRTSKKRS